jgi:hypothetical protein
MPCIGRAASWIVLVPSHCGTRGWRIYNVVGFVKHLSLHTTTACRGRGQGRAQRVYRRPLTPPPARPRWRRDEGLGFFQGFVLRGFFWLVPTKACLLESCGGPIPPAIYSMWLSRHDHDSFCNLPAACREAQRPIRAAMDLRPSCASPGYWTCEPAASRRSLQYSRTAKRRAMATFATLPPRRNFKR